MPFGQPTYRRVARHLANGVKILRQHHRLAPESGSRHGRFDPGVAAPDNKNLVTLWVDEHPCIVPPSFAKIKSPAWVAQLWVLSRQLSVVSRRSSVLPATTPEDFKRQRPWPHSPCPARNLTSVDRARFLHAPVPKNIHRSYARILYQRNPSQFSVETVLHFRVTIQPLSATFLQLVIAMAKSLEVSPMKSLAEELEFVRKSFRESIQTYSTRVEAQLTQIRDTVLAQTKIPQLPPAQIRDLRDMITLCRTLDLKPEKGRRKDLKKIDSLLEELHLMIQGWE
jgi:hypothetical protein